MVCDDSDTLCHICFFPGIVIPIFVWVKLIQQVIGRIAYRFFYSARAWAGHHVTFKHKKTRAMALVVKEVCSHLGL